MLSRLRAVAPPLLAVAALAAQESRPPEPRPEIPSGAPRVETASGLIYGELAPGEGERRPAPGDAVTVQYTGWLADGTIFDTSVSSAPRGSARFLLDQVIDGLAEGLQHMAIGATHVLIVPPALAYGAEGMPPRIPPDATLTFRVHLMAIESPPAFATPGDDATGFAGDVRAAVVAPGIGATCRAEQAFSMRYAVFTRDGRLLDGTFFHGGRIEGRIEDMQLGFLRELPLTMRPGSEVIVRVPAAMGFAERPTPPDWGEIPGGETVWRLRLDSVHDPRPSPAFAGPDADRASTTPSGLVYEELRAGEGEPPGPGDEVLCHYAGWLADGELFDASYPRGLPLRARVGELVPGWNEALGRMRPGAVWRVRIPAVLGYGPRGLPPRIPGGAELVFHIELIGPTGG